MVHLNELQEKYEEKGLSILSVSGQDKGAVEKFIEELEVKYPTICEKTNSGRAYGITGVPHSFLLDTTGRVLWRGHPGNLKDSQIDEALESVKILPPFPAALAGIRKYFKKEKYGDALGKLEKLLEAGRLAAEDHASAEQIRDWFVWYASAGLEGAKANAEGGKIFEAFRTYEHLAATYKKQDIEKQAKAALAELLADPDNKLEVKAGVKLAKIRIDIRDMSPKKALKKLRPMLSKKYAETTAGKKAAVMEEQLEQAIERAK